MCLQPVGEAGDPVPPLSFSLYVSSAKGASFTSLAMLITGLLAMLLSALAVVSQDVDPNQEGVALAAGFSNGLVSKQFQALYHGRENLVFAPFGLAASLAMVIETLDSHASEEARRVLRIKPEDKALLRNGFKNILLECERALQEEEAAGTYNKIMLLTAHNFSQHHYDILTDSYRVNVSYSQTPLTTAPDSTQVLVVQSDSGVMSHWKDYQKLAVYTYLQHAAAAPFYPGNGLPPIEVPLVPLVGVFRVGPLHRLRSTAVQIPLESSRVQLVLLLPDAAVNVDTVLTALPHEPLLPMVSALPSLEAQVALPQLAVLSSDLDLGPFLRRLGLSRLFTDPLGRVRSFKQNAYFSTSFVAVNSVGSITTQLELATQSGSSRSKREANKLVFDRPFLFFLVHSPSNAILLAGAVKNPTQVPIRSESIPES